MLQKTWRWIVGMSYVVAVAVIWIVASFVVQSVVDSGVSPFLITYVCNTLFVLYIPIVETGRWFQSCSRRLWGRDGEVPTIKGSEMENLLEGGACKSEGPEALLEVTQGQVLDDDQLTKATHTSDDGLGSVENTSTGYEKLKLEEEESKLRIWTRKEIARASLIVCPFWFLAQYTFNLSLKYTTVTSNTILSSTSSLFTFLMSLRFLAEKFSWLKLWSVLLCVAGTAIVSLSDSQESTSGATNPAWGDLLCLASSVFYAAYTTLIRKKLPDETKGEGTASTALFLGFLGLFNGLLFLPVALILHFTGVEPFHRLTLLEYGLVIGKGLFDNVLSDYLWAKAVLLTSTTAATAGLSIQVPIAAVVDLIRGIKLGVLKYVGGIAVLVGFFGINEAAIGFCTPPEEGCGQDEGIVDATESKETVLMTS